MAQSQYAVGTQLKTPFGTTLTVSDPNQFFSEQYVPVAQVAPTVPSSVEVTNPVKTSTFVPDAQGMVTESPLLKAPIVPYIPPSAGTGNDVFGSFAELVSSPLFTQATAGTIFRMKSGQQYYKSAGAGLVSISSPSQLQDLAKQGLVRPESDTFFDIRERSAASPPPLTPVQERQRIVSKVEGTSGSLRANADFVNAAFSAFHGRNANASELEKFTGMNVEDVRSIIKSGSASAAAAAAGKADNVLLTAGPSTTPTSDRTLDIEDVNAPDIKIPDFGNDEMDAKFLAAINAIFNSPEVAAVEAARSEAVKTFTNTSNELLKRGGRQREIEANLGIPDSIKQYQNLNAQIANKIGAMNLGEAKILDQPIPAEILYGQQAAFRRQQLAEISNLQAQQQAVAGNLELAFQIADRSVALEFEPVEQAIKNALNFLEINKDELDRADKKRADALSIVLQMRQEAVAERKAEKTANMQLMVEMTAAGGDPSLINPNGSLKDNLKVASPFLRNPKIETMVVEASGRKVLINSKTGDTIKDLGASVGDIKTQMVETADGTLLVDSATGSVIKNFGTGKDKMQRSDTRANQLADQFVGLEPVKVFNVVASGFATAQTLATKEEPTSADDVALIYAFAKAMDPNSVVRESEYAAIQKNAQAWKDSFGVDVLRVFSNEPLFASGEEGKQIRRNLASAIQTSYNMRKAQYDVIYQGYTDQINRVTGGTDGGEYLIDFSKFDAANAGVAMRDKKIQDQASTLKEVIGNSGGGSPTADTGKTIHGVDAPMINRLSSAIGSVESGDKNNPLGRYDAKGVVVTSGLYKGDRAYGKYQIMGKNIAAWTKEALGKTVSIASFLASPEIQDLTARFHIARLFRQYGNVEDVASAWFTGGPLARNRNRRDDRGTTASNYVIMVRSAMNRFS